MNADESSPYRGRVSCLRARDLSCGEWTAMSIDDSHRSESRQKQRKVFQLAGADRSLSEAECATFRSANPRFYEIWPEERARQDSNLRPPA
jgi:hypothetical protein